MQHAAETALRSGLEALDKRLGFRGPIGRVPEPARPAWRDGRPRPYRPGTDLATASAANFEPDAVYAAMIVDLPRGGGVTVDLGPIEVDLVDDDAKDVRGWREEKVDPVTGATSTLRIAIGDLVPVRIDADQRFATIVQTPALQGAIVVMDLEGRVKAMVGGYDWVTSQFNRVTQARRQIGSAIKPFIYAAAVAEGRTEVDRLYDGPIYVPTASGPWAPSNYDNKFHGWTTLRGALARSLNTISVQLMIDVGLDRVVDLMRGFGIQSAIPPN
jgi:penicillin-binding protein 1A